MRLTLADTWTTFQGRKVKVSEMDHQHLSNIYWYYRVILGPAYRELFESVLDICGVRFNGQVLPYRPHVEFKEERQYLEEHTMIIRDQETQDELVVFNDYIIGRYVNPHPLLQTNTK